MRPQISYPLSTYSDFLSIVPRVFTQQIPMITLAYQFKGNFSGQKRIFLYILDNFAKSPVNLIFSVCLMWNKEIFQFLGGFCLKRWYHQKYYLLWVSKNELKIVLASNWKLTAITTTFPIKNQIYFISLNKIRAHTKGATHTQKKFFLQCVSIQIFCHDKRNKPPYS